MLPDMNESMKPTGSAPKAQLEGAEAKIETARNPSAAPEPPRGRRGRRPGPAAPAPHPAASGAEAAVAQARQLLERLVRSAGYGWRDIDRMIHKNRGFTAHLLSRREGLPLNEVLAILDVINVKYDDFFALLFPRFDKPRFKKPAGAEVVELLGEVGAPEASIETEEEQEERARALWGRLDKINALIDQRVLDLMERALGAPRQLPPRPDAPPPAAAATEEAPPATAKE